MINKHVLTIRIDKDTKEQAQKIFRKVGLNLSSAVKLFLNNVIVNQKIPFEIKSENPDESLTRLRKQNLKEGLSKLNYFDLDEDS
jgi:DNA-damage-inducible protein J